MKISFEFDEHDNIRDGLIVAGIEIMQLDDPDFDVAAFAAKAFARAVYEWATDDSYRLLTAYLEQADPSTTIHQLVKRTVDRRESTPEEDYAGYEEKNLRVLAEVVITRGGELASIG